MPLGIMGDELRPLLINLRVAPQYLPYTTALMFEGFQEFLPIHAAEGCQSLGQLYDENLKFDSAFVSGHCSYLGHKNAHFWSIILVKILKRF